MIYSPSAGLSSETISAPGVPGTRYLPFCRNPSLLKFSISLPVVPVLPYYMEYRNFPLTAEIKEILNCRHNPYSTWNFSRGSGEEKVILHVYDE
jgi:hypothetical protein